MRFFILGCQRSGTNLTRLILDSHPLIWTFSENTSYFLLDNNVDDEYAKFQSLRYYYFCNNKDVPPFIDKPAKWYGYTVPGWTELIVEYECIKQKLEGKLIFMLRDPLQVVASFFRLNNFDQAIRDMRVWLKDPARKLSNLYGDELEDGPPDDKYWKTKWLTVFWKYKTSAFLKFSKENCLGVRYESLVEHPRLQIERMAKFLNIEWHDDLLRHHEKPHYETQNGYTIGNSRVDRSIDKKSISGWKSILDSKQQDIILKHSEELLRKLEGQV